MRRETDHGDGLGRNSRLLRICGCIPPRPHTS